MLSRTPIRRAAPRTSGAAGLSNFAGTYAPQLWQAEIDMFGTTVNYTPTTGGGPLSITGLWKEGVEDEAVSPGRYSTFDVQDGDIPNGPQYGDMLEEASRGTFVVSHIGASANGFSRLTLREAL